MQFLYLDNAGLLEKCQVEVIHPRQAGRVGFGRSRPLFSDTPFPEEDRLARSKRAAAGIEECAAVSCTFDVRDDATGLFVVDQGVDQFDCVHIGFIARCDDVTKADPRIGAGEGDAVAETSALRNQGDVTGFKFRRARDASKSGIDI